MSSQPAAFSDPAAIDGTARTDLGEDLTACDREPIHIPGSIQPHGLLLIADTATMRTIAGAGALEERFRADWLDRPVDTLLGAGTQARLEAAVEPCVALGPVAGAPHWQAIARRGIAHWLIELEPADDWSRPAADMLGWLAEAGSVFDRAPEMQGLCAEAVRLFRQITGFDRVMLYRFLDNDSGVVVAEEHADHLGGFLNHHFPASDIPRQARALYIRNRVRVIPDITYTPRLIRPAAAGLATIDLSDVDLRSVSPIHLRYLANMGVAASASISIVKDGLLWGLIACHHMTPRMIGYVDRRVCELVAAGLARQIRAKEEAEDYRDRLRVRAMEDAVTSHVTDDVEPEQLFGTAGEDLRRMLAADGFAVLHGATLYRTGACPDGAAVREIAAWLRRRGTGPAHSSALGEAFPPARDYRELASGVLGFTLSFDVPTVLMWFRAEELEIVNWAGNPHKAVSVAPGEMLNPRTSFGAWSEEVRGRSRRWTAPEVEAAHRLMRTLFDARQNRRFRDLNADLTAAVADKDALLQQKDTLIKEVNHRVQNSLQLVVAFLGMQARAENDATLTRHLDEAQRRLSAVALVHRRLYSDDNVETIDLARYLEELIAEMRDSMGGEWRDHITLDLAPILLPADAAVQVGLILVELVINAQKYAYAGTPGPIAITLEQYRNRFRLIVADRGGGRTGTRKGFGTRMLAAMVQRLDGTIDESDNRPGLRLIVTAPLDRVVPGAA